MLPTDSVAHKLFATPFFSGALGVLITILSLAYWNVLFVLLAFLFSLGVVTRALNFRALNPAEDCHHQRPSGLRLFWRVRHLEVCSIPGRAGTRKRARIGGISSKVIA